MPILIQARIGSLTAYYFARRVLRRLRPRNRRVIGLYSAFRADVWLRAAEHQGARYTSLPNGEAEIRQNGRRFYLHENVPSLDDARVINRCGNKPEVHALLARSGIPVPSHIVIRVNEFARARHLLLSSKVPLVVKPANGTGGGAGVSTNVTTEQQLIKAIAWARAYGSLLLVEEQVPGDCYRILIMNGEVLDSLVRKPPKVVSDGASTLRQVVRRENGARIDGGIACAQYLLQIDPDLRNTLARQGYKLSSVPPKGEAVLLKSVVNANASLDNLSANHRLCEEIFESARKAAKAVDGCLVGVDLICKDPSIPLEKSGGAIVEVNTQPGLHHHYFAADSCVPVADHILDRFFSAPMTSEATISPLVTNRPAAAL